MGTSKWYLFINLDFRETNLLGLGPNFIVIDQ